ncbi:hypothetical protein evm_008253 [Chilo suppressalis]|nr:hypothetical protein evm_008253 [Chilo suppressalis]
MTWCLVTFEMDPSSDRILSGGNGPIDYVVAYGHRIKVHRINSKDKFNKGLQELMNTINNERKKNASKLPRIIKTSTITNAGKRDDQSFGKISRSDTSGDCSEGPSAQTFLPVKLRNEGARTKRSQIPRRKISANISKEDEKIPINYKYFTNESRIQRVYLPNLNPDFYQDERSAVTSLASTRPIPDLCQMYRQNSTVNEDLYYDWYMELDVPRHSGVDPLGNAMVSQSYDNADTGPSVVNDEDKYVLDQTVKPNSLIETHKYKTTNDNISAWLSNEIEYPTKDNESGYSSLSPCNQCPFVIDSKHSDSQVGSTPFEYPSKLPKTSENFEETELKTANEVTPEFSKGCDSRKTTSSIAETDIEVRHDYSSQFQLLEEQPSIWSHHHRCASQSCVTFTKSDGSDAATVVEDSLYCVCHGKRIDSAGNIQSSDYFHDHKYHWCQRKHNSSLQGDAADRYKRQSRYRRFPSYKYKLTHPFHSLRKRLSTIGICRRRWNHVWKRTAARWSYRPKSHPKFNKYHMIQYLQSSTIWEDVAVQTHTLVFREAGTHTNTMEKKSTGVSTCMNPSYPETGSSSRSFKSRFKHINLGPSRFPFFYNSTQTSLPLHSLNESLNIVEKQSTSPSYQKKHQVFYDVNYAKRAAVHPHDNVTPPIVTTDTVTSPIDLHRMKTVEIDTGTDGILYHVNDKCISNIISSGTIRNLPEIKREEIATQMVVTFNNIETDISFTPFFKYNDMGHSIDQLSFYKPIGINTDSMKLESSMKNSVDRSVQMMTSPIDEITSESSTGKTHRVKQLNKLKSSWPKRWSMRCKRKKTAAPAPTAAHNSPTQLSPRKETTDIKKEDLCMETSPPCLVLTDAKILSISSAQLIEASAVTSDSDIEKPAMMHDQSNAVGSFAFHCYKHCSTPAVNKSTEAGERITGTETVDQNIMNKSTEAAETITGTETLDQNIGSNEIINENTQGTTTTSSEPVHKIIQSELKTPSLIDEWCQKSDSKKEGIKQKVLEQKSTDASAIVEKKSAQTVMSQSESKETQSDYSVKNNKKDEKNTAAFTSTYTSLHVQTKSIGQSTPEVFNGRQNSPSIIDTWAQYSQITDDSISGQLSEKQYLRTRIGHSKLMSAQVLNECMCDNCTQVRPSYYDTETDIMAPRKTSQQKSISIMTSYPIGDTPIRARSKERYHSLMCGCAYVDTETNTHSNHKITHNMESSTRSINNLGVNTLEKATSNSFYEKDNSASKTTRTTVEQIQSLSRRIGQADSSLQDGLSRAINSSILSSNLDADKWIKRCTRDEKEYQSIIDVEESALKALKRASMSIARASKYSKSQNSSKSNAISKASVICNLSKVIPPTPGDIPSNDSLADVLPVNDSVIKQPTEIVSLEDSKIMVDEFTSDEALPETLKETLLHAGESAELPLTPVELPSNFSSSAKVQAVDCAINNETKSILMERNKMMVDRVTSGELLSKQLKESILQTSPDIKEAGIETDTIVSNIKEQKSASVFTSKCILPKPIICAQNENTYNECIFVYDRPHCVVHKTYIDASVQSANVERIQDICPKVPELRVCHETGVNQTVNLYSRVGEVLSPKVYEALYETTKLAVKDRHVFPVRDTGRELVPTKEHDAASAKTLAIRSAAMVTSQCGLRPSKCHCHQEIKKEPGKAEYVFAYDTPQSSVVDATDNVSCHARVLDIPPYCGTDEHVKTQLVGSCRYYSNLLTKHFGIIKEKDAKRRTPTTEQCLYLSTIQKPISCTEAFTMKPSGREDLGCQTYKDHKILNCVKQEPIRTLSCCDLSPSLISICKDNEKHHLKSVYYMLSAIEGRIRRLKRNIPS